MNRFFICIQLLLITLFGTAQEDSLIIPGSSNEFGADILDQIYIVTQSNILEKFPKVENKHEKLYNYSNKSLGNITALDVSNPLKIVVSHGELSTLVLLDVTLRESDRFYLPDFQIFSNPVSFCMGYDNSIWIYDDVEIRLLRIIIDGQNEIESRSLVQILDFIPVVSSMQSSQEYFVLHDKNRGFIVLDLFGGFVKFIPQVQVTSYQLVDDKLLYLVDGELFMYPLTYFSKQKVTNLPKEALQFQWQNGYLYYRTDEGVFERRVDPSQR